MCTSQNGQQEVYRSSAFNGDLVIILDLQGNQITPSRCCAFRKLDKQAMASGDLDLINKTDMNKLIHWAANFMRVDKNIPEEKRCACPFARCTLTFGLNDDSNFLNHLTTCPWAKYGAYKCPYRNHDTEVFMVRQPKKSWCRYKDVMSALWDTLFSGFRKRLSGRGHQTTSAMSTHYSSMTRTNLSSLSGYPSVTHLSSSHRNEKSPSAFTSQDLLRRAQRVYLPDMPPLYENDGRIDYLDQASRMSSYGDIPITFVGPAAHIPDQFAFGSRIVELDNATTLQSLGVLMELEAPLTSPGLRPSSNTKLFSLGSHVSPKLFAAVIMEQAIMEYIADIQSPQHGQANFESIFIWPRHRQEELSSDLTQRASQNPVERFRSKSPLPYLNTGSNRPIPASDPPMTTPPGSPENLRSTSDRPEILDALPLQLFQELRSTFYNIVLFTWVVLYDVQREGLANGTISAILARDTSPAYMFALAWNTYELMVRDDQLPKDVWSLLALAQLTIASCSAIWETNMCYQFQKVYDELTVWAYALQNEQDRKDYLEIIAFMSNKPANLNRPEKHLAKLMRSRSPYAMVRKNSKISWTLDAETLRAALQEGIVIRLPSQFLTTFEYVQYKYNNSITRVEEDFQPNTAQAANLFFERIDALRGRIIDPLLAMPVFEDLAQSIRQVSDELTANPYMRLRTLEVALICRTRYRTQDYDLHLCFRRRVAELCASASEWLPTSESLSENIIDPKCFLLQDIIDMRQLQQCERQHAQAEQDPSFPSIFGEPSAQELPAGSVCETVSTQQMYEVYQPSPQEMWQSFDFPGPSQHMAMGQPETVQQNTMLGGHIVETPVETSFVPSYSRNMPPPAGRPARTTSSTTRSSSGGTSQYSQSTSAGTEATSGSFHVLASTPVCYPPYHEKIIAKDHFATEPTVPEAIHAVEQLMNPGLPAVGPDYYAKTIKENYNRDLLDIGYKEEMNVDEKEEEDEEDEDDNEGDDDYEEEEQKNKVAVSTDPRIKPLPPSPKTCHICKQEFTGLIRYQRANLSRHLREKHGEGNSVLHPCSICSKSFKRRSNMAAHMRKTHQIQAQS